MKIKGLLFIALALYFCVVTHAQTPPTPPDPLENSWVVQINGGYSYTSGNTNNGVETSQALRIANHWNVRNDLFTIATTPVVADLVKPEYRFSLAHLIPSNSFINTQNLLPFVNAGAGFERGTTGSSKFAYGAGGGVDVYVSQLVTVRPLELTWIHGPLFNGVVGNHLQFATSLGFTFGGSTTANAAFKKALKLRGKH